MRSGFDADFFGIIDVSGILSATFRSVLHSKLDADTIARYIGHLEEALLLSEAVRYDSKGRKCIGGNFKKIVVVKDAVRPHYNENGILTMGLLDSCSIQTA